MAEAVFDNFVAFSKLIFFPIAELFGGFFDGFGDFGDLFVSKRVVVDLIPIFFANIVAIILGALSDEEMEVAELFWRDAGVFETIDDLD